ncbi:hypothetical protein SAMN06298216_1556 [Spirosomataceae bacterium TFI 002]|nr:hypothetical protein SAMN06298216_1556 [Spirosomataceae bacterium TFI 002]
MKKLILALLVVGTSCTRIPYTQKVQDELASLGVKPTQIQYYLSNKVALQTNKEEKTKELQKGEIEIFNTITRERVVFGQFIFKELTGVCTNFGQKNYYVQFEEGDAKQKSLKFTWHPTTDRLVLAMQDDYMIDYDGARYYVEIGKGAHLEISKKAYTKFQLKTRRVKGMKVGSEGSQTLK